MVDAWSLLLRVLVSRQAGEPAYLYTLAPHLFLRCRAVFCRAAVGGDSGPGNALGRLAPLRSRCVKTKSEIPTSRETLHIYSAYISLYA